MESVTENARLIKRAYWLVKLRWLATVCVAIATCFSRSVLAIQLQDLVLYGIAVLLALYNMTILFFLNHITRINREVSGPAVKRAISFQICADLVLLTVILHFSGGIENPFAFYFVFHMIIASILLSKRESYLQATLAALLFGLLLLSEYLQLIPHHCLKGFVEHCLHRDSIYVLGTFFVFATSLYLVVYMTSDIAARLRQAEQALLASRDFLGRILNGMHDGLVVVDRNFQIKDVNDRFLQQCGVARDEAVGSKCHEISHHADKPCSGPGHICPATRVFDTAEAVQIEHSHFDLASKPYFIEINAFPLLAMDGNVEAVVELSHDITERKRSEQALMEANELLREKDRIKDEYVLRVTHDIKGHLTTIQYCLSPIVGGVTRQLCDREMDFLRRAYARAGKLSDFVKKLLRLTQMRLSNRLEMKVFSLGDALRNVVSAVKAKAEDKSITLDCNIDSSVGKIVGNQFSFEEMITNLLLNAVKYTPANGTVEILAEASEDSVFVQIADTGIGIPKEEQDKIFDEFYRSANAKSVERDGTGLGLSIVKYIVERHGGEIRVESEEGCGTTFKLRLPKDQRPNRD
ncbi:MAG: PAS domain-containing sensor histidine kinase [Phycisphaerales bacterium]|nr:MAG: PAS domain-containing sensor histidine kinase [Phycisphaerales bacterium]